MPCQICEKASGFYPLCKECNELKSTGEITKCERCGIWKKGDKPLCYDCWLVENDKKKIKTEPMKILKEERNEFIKAIQEVTMTNLKDENEFRSKFPPKYRTDDGHWVRSTGEMMIDNWLYHKGILHAYERRVPIEEESYCDFFINIGSKCYVEYWGFEDEQYQERKRRKLQLYKKHGKNLVQIENKDIKNLDDVLPQKLSKYLPKHYSFD